MNILIDGQTLMSPEINRGIGIYLKNVLNYMVKQSFVHTWFITVGNKDCLAVLDPWVAQRMVPIENNVFIPSTDYSRTKEFTQMLKKIVIKEHIDVFWCPNPLMVNVLFIEEPLSCKTYATLFDLIPAIMPPMDWSDNIKMEYNKRLKFLSMGHVDLFCISQATKNDFCKYVSERNGLYVTLLAADQHKFYRQCKGYQKTKTTRIVFTGGFDYRKNVDGALQAYATACKRYTENSLIMDSKFYIVCNVSDEMKTKFYAKAEKLGVKDKVILTGYLTDQQLTDLYYICDVFFFPSLYEGFGLPIIEAMLSGSYILSADNSSLPEVCGGHALFCNAENIDDMAEKLVQALDVSRQESVTDIIERQMYALEYSWEKTARETLEIIEKATKKEVEKLKIAIVTPWPNQLTGIANFEEKLMPYLSKYFEIDIFIDNTFEKHMDFAAFPYGELYMLEELDSHYSEYEEIIYEIGNNAEFHAGIYKKLLQYGGISEIHDFVLHPFMYHAFYLKGDKTTYKQALINGYGEEGETYFKEINSKIVGVNQDKFPMSHSIANVSKAVVFHNHWAKNQLDTTDNVFVIPLSCFDKDFFGEDDLNKRLTKLKMKVNYDGEIIIGCFGFVNSNKRPHVSIAALYSLIKKGYKVKLIFFGQLNDSKIIDQIIELNLSEYVYVTGYLEKEDYIIGLNFSDVILNLRYPSMGEASGTLCEAFKYGKPVIVSDINQYKEYPDEICWKLPVDNNEVEILSRMLIYLIEQPKVRRALGDNARRYADVVLNPEKIAKQYRDVLVEIMQRGKR